MNNEDELDFSFKDLDEKKLYAFCHAITSWQIITSYQLAEEILGSDANFEDKKKFTNEIFEKKRTSYIEDYSNLFLVKDR